MSEEEGSTDGDISHQEQLEEIVNTLLTINSPITVSNPEINPQYNKHLNLIINIHILIIIISKRLGSRNGNIKTLLTILSGDNAIPIIEKFIEYGAVTGLELETELGLSKPTVNKIMKKLFFLGLVETATVLFPSNPSRPGPRPKVWMLKGADPQQSLDCIRRHCGWGSSTQQTLNHNLREIVDEVFNYFMDTIGHALPGKSMLMQHIVKKYPTLVVKDRLMVSEHYYLKRSEWRESQRTT